MKNKKTLTKMKNQNNQTSDRRTLNKCIGCLLGGAIGDALGAPIEFMSLNEIRTRYGKDGVKDYVEFSDGHGEFTDDTQMTLFTAEALLRAEQRAMEKGIGGALPIIAHHSYLRWLHTQDVPVRIENVKRGVYDIEEGWLIKQKSLFKRRAPGNSCLSALSSGIAGTIENPINQSKGCGTIMRIAPVGLMFAGHNEHSFKIGCELSAITHGHPSGYLSAGFFASLISDLAIGVELDKAIENALVILRKWDNCLETLRAVNSATELFRKVNASGIVPSAEQIEELGQGWIAEEALSMSLFASLVYENDFEKGLLYSINHSGDSDSTGSITGNILGLINGEESINKQWIEKLDAHDIVSQMGEDLFIRVKGSTYETDEEWWEKYPGF